MFVDNVIFCSRLKRQKHEVRTCEYEDARVPWDMLNKADAKIAMSSPATTKPAKFILDDTERDLVWSLMINEHA